MHTMLGDVLKIFLPSFIAFFVGMSITPFISKHLYRQRMWKQVQREDNAVDMSQEYIRIHDEDSEKNTPRIGGIIIWSSIILATLSMVVVSIIAPEGISGTLNFLSRNQTVLPFLALVTASLVGLADDMLQIRPMQWLSAHGFSRSTFTLLVLGIGLMWGLWFFLKLGVSHIAIPFGGVLQLGVWFVPFFMIVFFGTFSTGVIDGIDGLAGGIMAIIFGGFSFIAYFQDQIDIAAFCMVVTGGILAFLWFNTPPARFYMGETGMFGLTSALTVVAFLTDKVLWLPILAFPLVITAGSSIVQIIAKKYFNKKILRVAPLHHHLQSLGWSNEKIVMRYWIVTVMLSIVGIILALIS